MKYFQDPAYQRNSHCQSSFTHAAPRYRSVAKLENMIFVESRSV